MRLQGHQGISKVMAGLCVVYISLNVLFTEKFISQYGMSCEMNFISHRRLVYLY